MTTIAAVRYGKYCVMVGDRKATIGTFYAEDVKKVRKINDLDMVIGGAGMAGHIYLGGDLLEAICNSYEDEKGMPIRTKTAARKLSRRMMGSQAMFILMGKNRGEENPGIYTIDPGGTNGEPRTGMASVGSGSPMALAALKTGMAELDIETNYGKDREIEIKDLAKIGTKAVLGSMGTDVSSGGNGLNIYTITEKGLEEYSIERPGSEGMLAEAYKLFDDDEDFTKYGRKVDLEYRKKGDIK